MSKLRTSGFWKEGSLVKQREGIQPLFENRILQDRLAHYQKLREGRSMIGVLQRAVDLTPRLVKRHLEG